MARILVVDDEAMVRTLVREVAGGQGHEVLTAETLAQGLAAGATGVDVVFLDVLLPDGNGLARIPAFAGLPGRPEVIVVTGHGDADGAETALRSGVWEYLPKPLRVQELTLCLARVVAYRAGRRGRDAQQALAREGIVGQSRALCEALDLLREAASSDVNVLILGETGTGKELFARALHRNSRREAASLVTLDCASLTENLVESQLFGHARGAFTGADRSHDGLLRTAHKGTLFLDEIGDLPLSVQGAFLRAMELRRFRPVGSVQEVESDFRLVAATNRDLHEMARLDMFRSDLLFRLRGITLRLPTLRERREDIPDLCAFAVDRYCRANGLACKSLADDFVETAMTYDWPGNVRELLHAVERACAAARDEDTIYARQFPTEIRVAVARGRVTEHSQACACTVEEAQIIAADGSIPSLRDHKTRAECAYVARLMEHTGGDVREAATLAGVSRGHLYELLKKHGLAR